MDTLFIIILLLVVLSIFIVLFFQERKRRKRLSMLYSQLIASIDSFLVSPQISDFSTSDDEGAELQNRIAKLEEQIILYDIKLNDEQARNHHFIADISHQLKTPLAALRLYSELSQDQYSEKEQVLIDRMEHLIFQLLRIEKIRSGSYQMKFEEENLSMIVREVWQELQMLYPEMHMYIDGEAVARVDKFWLKEAIRNILKNSCENASKNNEIHVKLNQTSAMVSIIIEDFAGGVHGLAIEQLFDRFNRSVKDLSSKNSGLGLAISKTIIQSHKGSIYAENTREGLKVSMFIPLQTGYRTY